MPVLQQDRIHPDKLLMRLELAPKKGNRDTEIYPGLVTEDTQREKWAKTLLRLRGHMRELRLQCKKFPYRYQPLTRMKLKDRLQKRRGKGKLKMPRPTTETADHPEHETESTESMPLNPKRSHPPRKMQIQPPESPKPEQGQRTQKANEQQKTTRTNNKKLLTKGTLVSVKYLQVPKRMGEKENIHRRRESSKKTQN